MIYTFELTEPQLIRITDYLDSIYVDRPQEYILGVQHRITDDLVFVVIECSESTAVYLHLMGSL